MRHLRVTYQLRPLVRYGAVAAVLALAAGCGAGGGTPKPAAKPARPAVSKASPAADCATVHLIVARASTEAPGDGIIGSLATLIQSGVKAPVTQEAVVYPATLSNYASSVGLGDAAMAADLVRDAAQCPQEKFVLLGYSQGAQVVGDILGGGGGSPGLGPATPPVPAAVSARVLAAIQMGDPRRIPGFSFDVGTDPGATGLFPRLANQTLASFASRIQSYCDVGDPFCARGQNLAAHLDYTFKYNSAALAFVLAQLHAAGIR